MSSDPKYIIGELVEVGTPEGSEQPRALIHCTEHDIAAVRRLPMLQRVAIVPLELLHGSAVPPIVEENRRLRDLLVRTTGSLGLIIKDAGAGGPGHRANYDAAKAYLAKEEST